MTGLMAGAVLVLATAVSELRRWLRRRLSPVERVLADFDRETEGLRPQDGSSKKGGTDADR